LQSINYHFIVNTVCPTEDSSLKWWFLVRHTVLNVVYKDVVPIFILHILSPIFFANASIWFHVHVVTFLKSELSIFFCNYFLMFGAFFSYFIVGDFLQFYVLYFWKDWAFFSCTILVINYFNRLNAKYCIKLIVKLID